METVIISKASYLIEYRYFHRDILKKVLNIHGRSFVV